MSKNKSFSTVSSPADPASQLENKTAETIADDITSCGSSELDNEGSIWIAGRAHKVANTYGKRVFRQGLREVMKYIKTAANSGKFECTIYPSCLETTCNLKDIIDYLTEHCDYEVKLGAQYNEDYLTIKW